jgi:hypothetical protein
LVKVAAAVTVHLIQPVVCLSLCLACAGLGVADPEQLLAMNHTQSAAVAAAAAAAASDSQHSSAEASCSNQDSDGGPLIASNSSDTACIGNGLGNPLDLQVQAQRLSLGGEPGSISNTDTEAHCADAAAPGVSGMQQNVSNGNSRPAPVDMPVVQGAPAGAKSGSQACGLAGKEWGLLELNLSFAWQLDDEPVEDVDSMLQSVAVGSR